MHKNTAFLVIVLTVISTLLLGFNLGRKYERGFPTTEIGVTPTPSSSPANSRLDQKNCQIKLEYPANLQLMEATFSAILIDPEQKGAVVILTCQKEIPRPAIPPEKIGAVILKSADGATFSAKLYHNTEPRDNGQPVEELIFTHPKTKLDVYFGGLGEIYQQILKTITVY